MATEGSSPCSQEPASLRYHEPDESSPYHRFIRYGLKTTKYGLEEKCIYSTYSPLSSTHLWLRCSNFFNPNKKNSFGCAGNRKSQRLISTPTYLSLLWTVYVLTDSNSAYDVKIRRNLTSHKQVWLGPTKVLRLCNCWLSNRTGHKDASRFSNDRVPKSWATYEGWAANKKL
jgi:hypothetical protein